LTSKFHSKAKALASMTTNVASSVRAARVGIVSFLLAFLVSFFLYLTFLLSYFRSRSQLSLSLSLLTQTTNNNRQTVTTTMSAAKKKVVPVRQYLDESVVPTLREAMKELVKVRPEDPHEFLAKYLMKHSPNQTTTTTTKSSSGVGNNSSGIRGAENNVRNDKATGVEEREEGEEKKEKDEGDAA